MLFRSGLLKPGASKAGNSAVNDPANWTIEGGKTAFLNNPQIQDQAFNDLAGYNEKVLRRAGVITDSTPPDTVAGYLATAHNQGAGAAIKLAQGTVTSDANGATTANYFKIGSSSVSGEPVASVRLPAEPPSSSDIALASNPTTNQTSADVTVALAGTGELDPIIPPTSPDGLPTNYPVKNETVSYNATVTDSEIGRAHV